LFSGGKKRVDTHGASFIQFRITVLLVQTECNTGAYVSAASVLYLDRPRVGLRNSQLWCDFDRQHHERILAFPPADQGKAGPEAYTSVTAWFVQGEACVSSH
jgi:hypothetical protein